MNDKVLLVDFMYLWNRIYFALKQDPNADFLKHMDGIVKRIEDNTEYKSKYLVLDGPNGTHRQKELLPEYKEGRGDKKEVYEPLNPFIKRCVKQYKSVKFVRAYNNEADEVIASLVKGFYKKHDIYLYSGDKDLLQLLVYPNVHIGMKYHGLFNLEPFTDDELNKKMNTISNGAVTNVEDIVKFRTFRGDASDKIPAAIPRFPSKTIMELIDHTWKGVTPLNDEILDNMCSYLPEKQRVKIEENRENILRNWELMQLQFLPHKQIIAETMRLS